ncbi:hypothetical protein BpHYR1_008220 [Brachionus plicatilis]|uniref:Uncharacterized protein n=1 Tax=Brachionus plicatilis TaxID=10195 RepID=A0A3M7QW52_BRAPC|nr:hypothetical protein BpHYR1_008220 [Brachionus plicatilis]
MIMGHFPKIKPKFKFYANKKIVLKIKKNVDLISNTKKLDLGFTLFPTRVYGISTNIYICIKLIKKSLWSFYF